MQEVNRSLNEAALERLTGTVRRRRSERQQAVPLDGIPTVPADLHLAFLRGADADGEGHGELGEIGVDTIAAATAEIRRRQLARMTKDPDFQLPEEMPRWA